MRCNMEKNQIWDHEINIMYHATCIKFGEIDVLVAYLSTSLFHDKSSQNLESRKEDLTACSGEMLIFNVSNLFKMYIFKTLTT